MSADHQSAVSILRTFFDASHGYLESTMLGVDQAALRWSPKPGPASILGQYAHIVSSEDWLVNVKARGGAALAATAYAGRTGFHTAPPLVGWDKWARQEEIDFDALRQYARAVYRATDEYLASTTDEGLYKPVDMSEAGMGQVTVGTVLILAAGNGCLHTGEISALKGLCNLTGYPERPVPANSAATKA